MAKRVLVEHRLVFSRRVTEKALNELGYEVTQQETTDWKDTVRLYEELRPEVVLVDGVTGPEIARELLKRHPEAAVIGCGVEITCDKTYQERLLAAGAKTFVKAMSDHAVFLDYLKKALNAV